MDAFEAALVRFVRSMPDEALLELVKHGLESAAAVAEPKARRPKSRRRRSGGASSGSVGPESTVRPRVWGAEPAGGAGGADPLTTPDEEHAEAAGA